MGTCGACFHRVSDWRENCNSWNCNENDYSSRNPVFPIVSPVSPSANLNIPLIPAPSGSLSPSTDRPEDQPNLTCLLLGGASMADSIVYGPESVASPGIACRSRISPAFSNKPAALDGPKDDGPKNDGPEGDGPEGDGPKSRVELWALGSSTLGSRNRAGAPAAFPAG